MLRGMWTRLIGCGALLIAVGADAAPRNRFGLAAGVAVPTYAQVDDDPLTGQPGPVVLATFDWALDTVWDAGAFLDVTSITLDDDGREEQVNAFSFGASVHYRLPLSFGLLRLGGGLGYRRLFADEPRYDAVHGVALNVDAELSRNIASGLTGLIELGILSQPFGGNGSGTLYWAPVPYVALGAVF